MSSSDLIRAVGGLAFVLLLILLLRFASRFLKPLARGQGGGTLTIEAQLSIDTKRRLQVVRCGDQKVLLLTGGPSDQMLALPCRDDEFALEAIR